MLAHGIDTALRVLPWTSADIEGAEHSILHEMLSSGALATVDVLALECHAYMTVGLNPKQASKMSSNPKRTCKNLMSELRKANPSMRLVTEEGAAGYGAYSGHDAYSGVPDAESLKRMARVCSSGS